MSDVDVLAVVHDRGAALGLRGVELTGPKGFLSAARWETDPDAISRDLGTRWRLTEIITKGYSACYFSHSSIDGIRDQMRRHGFRADDIASIHIDVSTPGWRAVCEPVEKKWQPETVPECQFSLAYAVATAAFDDRVFLDSYSEAARSRPDVRELMARITAREDPSVSDWGARLEIALRDGRTLRAEYVHVKGHPANPFSEQDFIDKFRMCLPYSAVDPGAIAVDRMLEDILAFETVDDASAALLAPLTIRD